MFFLTTATAILLVASAATTSLASSIVADGSAPMHIVFGSIPCYGHWNPVRSVAKALYARGHHVTLFMEEDKNKWCTSVKETLEAKKLKNKNKKKKIFDSNTFNCFTIPSSKTFKKDFFINMSKSDDIPSSFEELFKEMFLYQNVTQDDYSRAMYVLRELTTGYAGTSSENYERCSEAALRRAASLGLSEADARAYCSETVPPISLLLTDSATYPAYNAALQFGIPSMALFPLSVNLPSSTDSYMPMLGSGRPAVEHMSFADRLSTYTKRIFMMVATKYIAVPHIFDLGRSDANKRQQRLPSETSNLIFPNTPTIPNIRGGVAEASMMNSIIFTPGIWGYDIAHPLCGNIVAIGSTAVEYHDEDDEDETNQNVNRDTSASFTSSSATNAVEARLVPDRRIREFGGPNAVIPRPSKGILNRRNLLEDQLSIFLEQSPACVNYGAVYVNFGTLSVLSDETFNRVLAALWHVPFCVVWKITENARFERVKAMVASEKMPEELKSYAASIIASGAASSRTHPAFVPDTGVSPRGRFYIGKHFNSPDAILEHDAVKVFISHCGDTSVLESIHALVPVAGIPIFADQPDVCQRIEESGFGSYIGAKSTFDPERLVQKLIEIGLPSTPKIVSHDTMYRNLAAKNDSKPYYYTFNGRNKKYIGNREHYLNRVFEVRRMSTLLGGPAKAAAIIESHYEHGLLNMKEAMMRQKGPLPQGAEDGIRLDSHSSERIDSVHPMFSECAACSQNRLPFANRDLANKLEQLQFADGGKSAALPFTPLSRDKGAPYFGVASFTVVYNFDVLALIFINVGIAMLVAIWLWKKLFRFLRKLLKGFCTGSGLFCGSDGSSSSLNAGEKVANTNKAQKPKEKQKWTPEASFEEEKKSTATSNVVPEEHIRIRAVPLK